MSLYHKYRPDALEAVKGNENIITTLKGMLSDVDKCPHVFLLHGPSGCGKTTIGRIIASELGCKGSDLREINTADNRGIDTVREIIKNSQFKPLEGSCRVWIIDECHKLTNDSQNAFLKPLEDTPAHVYFILCTTDPQKLITPIRSRSQEFQVKPLSDVEMKSLLRMIVRSEGEKLDTEIYDQIIQDTQGHPRAAINVLEQVLNVDVDKRLEVAKRAAELQSQSIELCRLLMKKSTWKEINTVLNGLKDQEPEDIRRVVLGYCQAILLKSDNARAGLVMECFIEPFYNTGFPGLVFACYQVSKN